MSPKRDIPIQPPDPEQVNTTMRRSLKWGSQKELAELLKKGRQYVGNHYLRKVFGEAALGFWAIAVKDQKAFLAVTAYWLGMFSAWTHPNGRESAEELFCSAMDLMTQLLKLRQKSGTRHDQIVLASQLQATATKLTAKLSETPSVSPLKMVRVGEESSSVQKSYRRLKREMKSCRSARAA